MHPKQRSQQPTSSPQEPTHSIRKSSPGGTRNLPSAKGRSTTTDASPAEAHWYAIYTRSRFEKKLYRRLRQSAITAFLPLIKEKRAWSDRLKTVEAPLLPSYVFIKVPASRLRQVYQYPGVVRLVAFDGQPCVVPEKEIFLLRQIVEHGFSVQATTECGVGDQVRISRGPLRGWEGQVARRNGPQRVVFQLDSVRQAISVEVGMEDLEKI